MKPGKKPVRRARGAPNEMVVAGAAQLAAAFLTAAGDDAPLVVTNKLPGSTTTYRFPAGLSVKRAKELVSLIGANKAPHGRS